MVNRADANAMACEIELNLPTLETRQSHRSLGVGCTNTFGNLTQQTVCERQKYNLKARFILYESKIALQI